MLDAFKTHAQALTCLSLGADLPNALSVPHMISKGFKDVLSIGLATGIQFKELTAAQSGPATTAAAPTQAAQTGGQATKAAEPEPEPVEEEVSMGGLFD